LTIESGLLAPIGYYKGVLFFVPRNMDHGGLTYTSIYVGVNSGSFVMVGPAAVKK